VTEKVLEWKELLLKFPSSQLGEPFDQAKQVAFTGEDSNISMFRHQWVETSHNKQLQLGKTRPAGLREL
jgi:hypothetical protein